MLRAFLLFRTFLDEAAAFHDSPVRELLGKLGIARG